MRLYEIFKRQEVDQSLPYDEIDIYNAGADQDKRRKMARAPLWKIYYINVTWYQTNDAY